MDPKSIDSRTYREPNKRMDDVLWNLQEVFWNGGVYKFCMVIEIRSMSVSRSWKFPAFVKTFTDKYDSKWNAEDVFGRIDPIYTYKNTYRHIDLQITVPAMDMAEAFHNWVKINELTQALYPGYKTINNEQIISTPPIFGMKFHNLVKEANTGSHLEDFVYGVFESGLAIEPNVDEGFLYASNVYRVDWNSKDKATQNRALSENYGGGKEGSGLLILPKSYTLSLPFSVIHSYFRGNRENELSSMGGPMVSAKEQEVKEFLEPGELTRTQQDVNASNAQREKLTKIEEAKKSAILGKK